jgi:PAS domain S-box-containing protein
MVVEEHHAHVREVLTRALAGEGTSSFEFTVRTADGRLRDVLFNATAQRDAAGRVVGAYGVGQVRAG